MTSLNLLPRLSAAAGPRPAPTANLPAVDETRGTPVGVVVAAKGGQKAQQDAAEKEIEQRARRDRAERVCAC
ncbi:MAG: hypothetical protein Q8K85_15650 [Hyphomicrobium sp.]|nr:hypothetical protein [Hyphomicrobium sp.]